VAEAGFLRESGWKREQGFLEYFMSKINAQYKLPLSHPV
jgi:hypothetical protein